MGSLNKVQLIGNLGSDPKIRFTESGTPIVNFSLATNEKWKDKAGQLQARVEWHKIAVWGNLANVCQEYLSSGKSVYVEGRLQTTTWTDKEGIQRYTVEVVAQNVQFLGNRNDGDGQGSRQKKPPPSPQPDDDLPF